MKKAEFSYLNDIDIQVSEQLKALQEHDPHLVVSSETAIVAINHALEHRTNPADTIFIYLDPPYPKSSRKDQRDIYRHEMTDEEHEELITYVKGLQADSRIKVMISSYAENNPIYTEGLASWDRLDFPGNTRKGKSLETIWTNYKLSELQQLQDYRYLGRDYREREKISRRNKNMVRKLGRLPELEKQAILNSIYQEFSSSN